MLQAYFSRDTNVKLNIIQLKKRKEAMASPKQQYHKIPECFEISQHYTLIQSNAKSVMMKNMDHKELCVILRFCMKNSCWPEVM